MKSPQNILVIRFGSLGDVILTSAATLNLKLNYPFARITYLTKSSFSNLVRAFPGVDAVETISDGAGATDLYSLALELDNQRFDFVVDLHRNIRSRFVAALLGAERKVTYSKNRLLREALVRFKSGVGAPHTIDAYNRALLQLDSEFTTAATTPQLLPSFYDSCAPSAEIARWRSEGRRIVFVAPGARYETKRAPLSLFADSLCELATRESIGVINAYRRDEGELSFADSFDSESYVELVDKPLPELTARLAQSDAALVNDSGVAHIASAVGTPALTLFGPTHSGLGFSPRGVFDQIYEMDVECRPCSLHGSRPCKRSERYCFTSMSASAVSTKLTDLLVTRSSLRPALFLDRDGTVIVEKEFLSDPAGVELHSGVAQALRSAREAGFALVLVSNQSGVARGYFDEEAVRRVNQQVVDLLEESGVALDGVYYCPNHPSGSVDRYRRRQSGRKPADQMFVRAAREIGLDLRASWVIGDRRADYLSAAPLAGHGALALTGYGEIARAAPESSAPFGPEIIAADLPAVVAEIHSKLVSERDKSL